MLYDVFTIGQEEVADLNYVTIKGISISGTEMPFNLHTVDIVCYGVFELAFVL